MNKPSHKVLLAAENIASNKNIHKVGELTKKQRAEAEDLAMLMKDLEETDGINFNW